MSALSLTRRVATLRPAMAAIVRFEPLLILLVAPLLMFPRPQWIGWLLGGVALLWSLRWLATGRLTRRTPLDAPILLVAMMAGVSLWATFDLTLSFPKLCGLALGIITFYALVNGLQSERALWLATGLLLAGGAAVAGAGLVGTRWSSAKVPLLAGLPPFQALYDRVPQLISNLPRAEQGFNANQVAGTLVLFVPLAAVLLLYRVQHPRRTRSWVATTLGLAAVLALTTLVLVLTQSRASYLALLLTLPLVGALQKRWVRLPALLLLALAVGVVAYFGIETVGEAIFGIPNLEALSAESSWAGRVEIWKRAVRVIRDHPLTGIGFDTLFPVIHARYPTFLMEAGHDATHAHNIFLQVALNLGLPGLTGFVWLLAALARMLWQVWQGRTTAAQRALAAGLLLGLLAHFIYGLGDALDLGSKPGIFIWAYFGLGAALWLQWSHAERAVAQVPPRRPTRTLFRPLLGLAAVLLVLWGYTNLRRAATWRALVEADLGAAQALVQDGPSSIAPASPQQLLGRLRADLEMVQREFALPLAIARHLSWLPEYGADLETLPTLLDAGLQLAAGSEQVLQAVQPLLEVDPSATGGWPELAVSTLQEARPQLVGTLDVVEAVRQARSSLCDTCLSPPMRRWVARLDQLLPPVEQGLHGALALPELLGASHPQVYLILVQNDDELRATGGFISGVARVTVDRGHVVDLSFQDSYAIDDLSRPYPDPPRPLREIMGAQLWLFRDSNWHPDFPTTAQKAIELYRWSQDGTIDGVLALDQRGLQLLVAALEPLQVAEYPVPLTRDNVVAALRESWAPEAGEGLSAAWRAQRKDFIGRLLTTVVNRLQHEPGQVDPGSLAWALFTALNERHLFAYLPQTGSAAEMLHETGWDGALQPPPGDYLMVVDANVGFNKVNPQISESLTYDVDLQEMAQPRATLTLLHRHTAQATGQPCRHEPRYDLTYAQMMQRCYWDYLRVYVPHGSRPLEATPHPVPADLLVTGQARDGRAELLPDAGGKTAFATLFVLSPQESVETRFVYDLPPQVLSCSGDRCRYQLTIQKQAGTDAHPVHVTLSLPDGSRMLAASPEPAQRTEDGLRYELSLRTDLELEVVFSAK